MPTICSACGRTAGRCEGCTRADIAIREHENPTVRAALGATLAAIVPNATSSIGTSTQAETGASSSNPEPDQSA